MLRNLSIALSTASLAALVCSNANAAISVLGNSVAHACYMDAEYGNNPRDGINDCTDALEQTPLTPKERAATYINRGILYSRIDQQQRALADYDTGLALNGSLGEGYVDRGAALIALKRFDEALRDIDKGISLGANHLEIAYYDRGMADEALGNVRAAYLDFKKAVEIEPGFTLASEQLARFKVIRRRTDGT